LANIKILAFICVSLLISVIIIFEISTTKKKITMPGPRSAKKAQTPPKTVAKKVKGQKYEYVELGKASLSSVETQNAYGVIIDATFPYKTN